MTLLQQQANGKALEYACALAFETALASSGGAKLLETRAARTARRRYQELNEADRTQYLRAAEAAVKLLAQLEPMLLLSLSTTPTLSSQARVENFELTIQADAQGEIGDVRDVLINNKRGWEIGLSIKHNNDVVKNPRLSGGIDFCKLWMGRPCSSDYFKAIKPTFDQLDALADVGAHWSSLGLSEEAKAKRYYRPVMQALALELKRLAALHTEAPASLLRYLLGRKDFYKVIADARARTTTVQAFSIDGTLGQRAGALRSALNVERLAMPAKLLDVSFKPDSDHTIIVRFDQGWAVSMRLHNASSMVERSLKLDVRLAAWPRALVKLEQRWNI